MTAQMSFAAGEIAPSLYARTDQARYQIGLRTCRNFFIAKSGGAVSRPGTQFIGETKIAGRKVRLIEFVFSDEQSYILEFGHRYIRFYQNGARLKIISAPQWSSAVTYIPTDVVIYNSKYYYARSVAAPNLNRIPSSISSFWYEQNSDIYEIPSPYQESELNEISYSQSADVIAIAHHNYAPRYLRRLESQAIFPRWDLIEIKLQPSVGAGTVAFYINPPGSIMITENTAIPKIRYQITHVSPSGEEGLPASTVFIQNANPVDTPVTVGVLEVPELAPPVPATHYNIYREISQGATTQYTLNSGYIGKTTTGSFTDNGQIGAERIPPSNIFEFNPIGDQFNNNPSVIIFTQNRLGLAGRPNQPETIYMSRIGSFGNFTAMTPVENDHSIVFTINGSRVDIIRHLIELDRLISMTSNNEWAIRGNQDGVITPTSINAKKQSENGISRLSPIIANETILFVQARQNIVRDFMFDFEMAPYKGNDLTIFSSHLFESKQIISWAYQATPHSIFWLVLNDGRMLSMTYNREHQMVAWARHDTDGVVEDIAVIPESAYDRNYMVVKRLINGQERRYIERMLSRDESNPFENEYVDSMLFHDAFNKNPLHVMKLTHGSMTSYPPGDKPSNVFLLTLTDTDQINNIVFNSNYVGEEYRITYDDGTVIDFVVTHFVSGNELWVMVNGVLPPSLIDVSTINWARKLKTFSGIGHLEGKKVSVIGDGFVIHSAGNPEYPEKIVSGGAITLDKAYARVFIGLPYISDLETLDLDSYQGERKNATRIEIFVKASKGIFAGNKPPTDDEIDPLEDLREFKLRTTEAYNEPTRLFTERLMVDIPGEWTKGGRVFIRQIDPIPLSILSVQPMGFVPSRGGQ